MSNKRRSLPILSIAVVLAAAAVMIPLFFDGDSSDGAEPSFVNNATVKIYDQDSSDYSDLAYISDDLPTEFNAAEWVKDTATGVWYNINSRSPYYGDILRYGNITGITNDEIRSDIASFSPYFSTASFVIMQIGCDISGDCTLGIEVKKDGSQKRTDSVPASLTVAGCFVSPGVEYAKLYSVTAGGDIDLSDKAGMYSISLKCNGLAADNASADYKGTVYYLDGSVKDKNNKEIPGASIAYEILDSEGTLMKSDTIVTGSDGTYRIESVKGTIVNITSVTAAGFTFATDHYSYGTITGNVSPGMTFKSNEAYIKVIVTDRDSVPAADVEIKATWFTCTSIGGGKYRIDASEEGLTVPSRTNSDGEAIVTIANILSSDARLIIKGMTGKFTFEDVAPIYETPETDTPLPTGLPGAGNVYADLVSYTNAQIKADDHSVLLTAAGNIDSSSAGGAALQGVHFNAVWYYQYTDSGEYIISQYAAQYFNNLRTGKAWFSTPYSAQDGTVLLHYIEPTWDTAIPSVDETAFLYAYIDGAYPNSTSYEYTYTYALPVSGTKTVAQFALDYDTCTGLEIGSITEETLRADEPAYTINGTITGTVPASATVYCTTPTGKTDYRVASSSGGSITFSFTVKAGVSCTIEIDDIVGYEFTNQKYTLPSAFSNLAYSSVASESSTLIDRDTPTDLQTISISGGTDGDVLAFKYTVAGTEINVTKKIDSDPCELKITGWAGNVISGLTVNGDNIYIGWTGTDSISIAHMTQMSIVTYYNTESDLPTINNAVGGQTIQVYCDDTQYSTVLTDAVGKAVMNIPNIPNVTFRFGEFTVASAPVTQGAYDGCIGLNLKDLIDSPAAKHVTVTIRHIATSSLQNESAPTNVDILTGPETLTLTVGETKVFMAPEIDGFSFSGWFINGSKVTDTRNPYQCNLSVTEDMEGSVLVASYAANSPEPPKENWGTTIAIGILSVTIALIAMIYVILQVRRY